jgi:hypothetical protein
LPRIQALGGDREGIELVPFEDREFTLPVGGEVTTRSRASRLYSKRVDTLRAAPGGRRACATIVTLRRLRHRG